MRQHCDCEYLLADAKDYISLLLSCDLITAEVNQDFGYELLDRLMIRLGEDNG
jgi:hypothetical protein